MTSNFTIFLYFVGVAVAGFLSFKDWSSFSFNKKCLQIIGLGIMFLNPILILLKLEFIGPEKLYLIGAGFWAIGATIKKGIG